MYLYTNREKKVIMLMCVGKKGVNVFYRESFVFFLKNRHKLKTN